MADTRIARIVRHRRRQRQRRENSAPRVGRWLGCGLVTFLISLIVLVALFVTSLVGVYAYYARALPPANAIVEAQEEAFETSIFYERTGQLAIYEVIDPFAGDRKYATLDSLPEHFLQATIAIEDATFYDNPGFNVEGLLRASVSNLEGNELQGGSSITQQLVKNALIPPEERTSISIDRKIKELILASEISRLYSKDQILEWYINTNFYGNLAYGIEAAARIYFDKPAQDLTLAESAVLAAVPQFPLQNPIDNQVAARQRQEIVLNRMVELGYISQAQQQVALQQPLIIKPLAQNFDITAPHFALYARGEAEAILNYLGYDGPRMISQEGLRIYTTLDLDLQQQLECVSRSHVERLSSGDPNFVHNTNIGSECTAAEFLRPPSGEILAQTRTVTNAAGVVLNASTGEIKAMMGSIDFWDETIDGNFNGALARRQPASTFKPFVYVTAFLHPFDSSNVVTPAFMTSDVYTEFDNNQAEPYIPLNLDRQFHGPVSVRDALARSYNVPAVQVLNLVGLQNVLNVAHGMGINSMSSNLSNFGLSLALGTAEASLLDMTYAYNTFNNLGTMIGAPLTTANPIPGYRQLNPVSILRIEDADGNILWQYGLQDGTFDRRIVLPSGMAYLITDILADNDARYDAFPRGSVLELSRPAAVKTGTSDEFRDSWTIGYTPQYTTGIWVGNNDNRLMQDVTGLVGAAPIWHAVMEYIHERDALPIEQWQRPETIKPQNVCLWSGLLATSYCPQVTELFYVDPVNDYDYRPNRQDNLWIEIEINSCNDTLATVYTPTECRATKTYFQYPENMREWAEDNPLGELPPTESDTAGTDSIFSPVRISDPIIFDKVSGVVDISGNASDDNFFYYYLEVGKGTNPDEWQSISDNVGEGGNGITLGVWDTTTSEDGLHILRLTMVRHDQTTEFALREVIIDNTPPTVRLIEPGAGTYSRDRDVFIEVVAEAFDNDQVELVEFYVDGELVHSTNQASGAYQWEIHEESDAEIWAVVTDAAGNQTQSETVTVQLED
ncbi:MAG: transglycosylase domain-containing protein [Chloroflexi bacterium]|nr:transglycosylase domain-containing protein [Chloroflexota bacterium]